MHGLHWLFAQGERTTISYGRHALILEAGIVLRFDRQPTNGLHWHNYFEVCLVLSGIGRFVHGGTEFAVRAGDVFLADPGVRHEISSLVTRDLELVFVSFEIQREARIPLAGNEDRLLEAFPKSHRVFASATELLERYRAWRPAKTASALTRLARKRLLEIFLMEIVELLSEPSAMAAEDRIAPGSDVLKRAVDYIDSHLEQPITPGWLAAHIGISPRQLRRVFRAQLKTTVVAEINRLRMNAAAHQLLMRIPITEVAYRFGFQHPSHFTRLFKRSTGLAPRDFQRHYQPRQQLWRTERREGGRSPIGKGKAKPKARRAAPDR